MAFVFKIRVSLMRDTGAVLSPFNAWLFLIGLETLQPAGAPPLGECARRCGVPKEPPEGCLGETIPDSPKTRTTSSTQKYLLAGMVPLSASG